MIDKKCGCIYHIDSNQYVPCYPDLRDIDSEVKGLEF